MRINDRYSQVSADVSVERAERVSRISAAKSTSVDATERKDGEILSVAVSGRAADLAGASARVAELKKAIQEGTFEVNVSAIAKALVG